MLTALFAAALAAPACTAQPTAPEQPRCVAAAPNWRTTATEDDRRRIRRWRDAWTEALAQARTGNAADIAREGALLEPDAALSQPLPPAGDYNCRTIKLGTPMPDLLNYIGYPSFRCRIRREGGHLTLTKLTGSQRPVGRLFPDTERRVVFLGTLQLGDESRAFQYGVDQERDMAGLLERVGERRWRLVFPYPHFESLLDVIELTP